MSQVDTMRYVYMLTTVAAEVVVIVQVMKLCWEQLLAIMNGMLAAIPIVELEPEFANSDGNPHDEP